MAKINPQSILAFLCILNIFIPTVFARIGIPADSKNEDMKHLDSFKFDRNFHFPRIGRVKIPNHIKGFNPITHNPVPSTGQRYIPGGDDTFVPNPGVEVPIPGRGNVLVPSAAHP